MDEKAKKIDSVDNVVVSSSVLGSLFGLTTRRVRQLSDEGVIKKVSRGRYNLSENIKNYILYIKTSQNLKENNKANTIDYEVEHALLERRKREKMDLEIAAMKGTMHNAEDVERVMTDMLANFRAKLLALPSKSAPRLLALETISDIQDILQEEVFETLNELSNYDPTEFYNDEYIDTDTMDNEDVENVEEDEN